MGLTQSIDRLSPFSQSGTEFWWIQPLLFESLLRRDTQTYAFKPALAHSYKWSQDRRSLTFELRSGLKWSDGQPLTAEDVRFSVEVHSKPIYKSIYQGVYDKIIERVEILSKTEVKFYFHQVSLNNLNTVSFNLRIYPKHFYGNLASRGEWNRSMVTSGAYQIQDFDPGKSVHLKRNKHWYGFGLDETKNWYPLSEINFLMAKNEEQLYDLMVAGKVDYFRVSDPLSFKKLAKRAEQNADLEAITASDFKLLGRRAVLINHNHLALKDLRVRKALVHLFNRNEINEKLYANLFRIAKGPWNQNHPGADNNIEPLSYDPKLARQLLAEAGWKDNNKDGIREKIVNGQRRDLILRFVESDPDNKPLLTMYQQAAAKVGVGVSIMFVGFTELMRMFENGEFDAAHTYSLWGYYELDLRSWYHSQNQDNPWTNIGQFRSQKMDALIEQIERTRGRSQRLNLYKQAYRLLSEQLPDLYWFEDKYFLYFTSRRVERPQDILPYSLGLHTWSLKNGHN